MPKKKNEGELSLREKSTYMMYLFILDKTPKMWGVYSDVCKIVANRMDFENYRSVKNIVHNVVKKRYEPSLLDIQEFYNRLEDSETDAGKYFNKRKQKKAK